MISQGAISDLSVKLQTSELNIAREYCQHLFLHAFYQNNEASLLCFKGGTALRLIYKSPRFSEDLDFEHTDKTPYDFNSNDIRLVERILTDTLVRIEKTNVAIRLGEAKTTGGGYLTKLFFQLYNRRIEVLTEISLRGKDKFRGESTIITSDFFPNYSVVALPRQNLIGGKLQALESRGKPRDFFDLYYILRADLISLEQRSILPKIILKIPQDANFFTKELLSFLPTSYHGILKNFPQTLKSEIERFTGNV